MDIEEAKVILKEFNEDYEEENGIGDLAEGIAEMVVDWNDNEAIETILSELDKKDKIINEMKWKPISKYNQKEYDWVLVKYFDGDYECVPDVAEKRSDDRWYNSSGEIIPFEVKYFFDMQILDYFTNKVEEDIKE